MKSSGGSHGTDLQTADHRFFQYEYRVRLIGDEIFGKDIELPELKITYKMRSRTEGDILEGRDQTYVLPPISVRVISLVPADAVDIRDASLETFGDIDRRLSRANVLRVVGGVLIGFAALAALVAVARVVRSRGDSRGRTAPSLVSDAGILRDVGRELADIQHTRRGGEWTPGLAARLLTALRIISAYALGLADDAPGRRPGSTGSKRPDRIRRTFECTQPRAAPHESHSAGLGHAERHHPGASASARRAVQMAPQRVEMLENLRAVLGRLTAAQYGRDNQLDGQVLDDALDTGVSALRQLKIENVWVVKKMRSLRLSRADVASRAWSR